MVESDIDPKYAASHFFYMTLLHLPLCAKSSRGSLSQATVAARANEISMPLLLPNSYIPNYLPFQQETLQAIFNTSIRIGDILLIPIGLDLI
jgi:hypothetical protein